MTSPSRLAECVRDLEALTGVEVHYCYPDRGQIVAVQEGACLKEQTATLARIQDLPHVILADLVYHYAEPDPAALDPDGCGRPRGNGRGEYRDE